MTMMPSKLSMSVPDILTQALWIWPDSHFWNLVNGYALFRKDFQLSKVPGSAPLYVSADQAYELYINGHYVCSGPARGFQKSWPYDCVDVRSWLKKGENLIAVRAYNPGTGNFQYVHRGFAGLILAAQWGNVRILTDKSWKCRRQRGIRKDMAPTSLQLFPQENIDLRVEDPDWFQPEYQAGPEWSPTEIDSCRWNRMPISSMQARGIPMLDESLLQLGEVIGKANGKSHAGYLDCTNLSLTRFQENLSHQPASGTATDLTFQAIRKGQWRSYLIDLGKLHVGRTLLDIPEALGGEIVETHHYETLDNEKLCPDFAPDAHCRMAFSQRLTCRPGRNQHAFFHPFGFRYVVLTVRDNNRPIRVKSSFRSNVYPLKEKGHFDSGDSILNDIWKTCAWTQRVCSMDAYVDTPWREQAQWWGDARVQAWNTFHLDGDDRLFRRGIRQIASQATNEGVTYGHAPTIAHSCILPDFTLIWIVTLWDHYWQTGSLDAFNEHHPAVEQALSYFQKWIDPKTGLLRYDPRYWLFLDWTQLPKDGCSSVYSLWLLYALQRLEQLYALKRQNREARNCQRWAGKLRSALRRLINTDGLMRDGYASDGKILQGTSVHAQTLTIMTGLAPRHEKTMLHRRLLAYLQGTFQTDIRPSAYWITYIYTILAERGYANDVLAHIREHWAPMSAHGTTWENFNPTKAHESHSHAWSAHPLFHLMQILGGIRQAAPAWKEVTFVPAFIGDKAHITIPSPQGMIRVSWKRNGSIVSGSLQLPAGIHLKSKPEGINIRTKDRSISFETETK